MARFFKFHTVAELETECQRLGLDLHFTSDLTPLFRPVSVGPFHAGNALCIQPMEGCDCTLAGEPDELTFRRFRRFGAGGAKLIWGEAAAVLDEGRASPRQLLINEANAPAIGRMLEECRRAHREAFGSTDDLIVGLQLTHSGRYSFRQALIASHDPLLDPRTVVDKGTGKCAGPDTPLLDDDYLERLPDHYLAAARIAHRVGFQFVDIKQCHRYLLNELLSARTRPGKFGGSLENRTRLARTIFERIRQEVPGLMIATRLNVFDGLPFRLQAGASIGEPNPWQAPVVSAWGTNDNDPTQADLTEPRWWIGEMGRLGVGLINITMGNPYASPHILRPFEYPPPDGYEAPEHPLIGVGRHFHLAGELQRAFPQVPMVGSGYSYLQEFIGQAGAANIRDGRITFMGVGRAALPMPDIAQQLQKYGKLDRKRICRTFSYCTALMRAKHNELGQFATGCPPFDKEVYGPIWNAARTSGEGQGAKGDDKSGGTPDG